MHYMKTFGIDHCSFWAAIFKLFSLTLKLLITRDLVEFHQAFDITGIFVLHP